MVLKCTRVAVLLERQHAVVRRQAVIASFRRPKNAQSPCAWPRSTKWHLSCLVLSHEQTSSFIHSTLHASYMYMYINHFWVLATHGSVHCTYTCTYMLYIYIPEYIRGTCIYTAALVPQEGPWKSAVHTLLAGQMVRPLVAGMRCWSLLEISAEACPSSPARGDGGRMWQEQLRPSHWRRWSQMSGWVGRPGLHRT